jgi:predicted site-specific integrase-resolvase
MVKCPYCVGEEGFNELKSWRFRFYTVKRIQCIKCKDMFNLYFRVSPRDKKSEFVIKVKAPVRGNEHNNLYEYNLCR